MGTDLPDEADGRPDRRDDENGGGRPGRAAPSEPETRDREEYYVALRVAVSAEKSVAAQQVAAREQEAAQKWDETTKESRWIWSEYQRRWPPEDREPADSPDSRDTIDDSRFEATCARIAKLEREEITPAMRTIESQDPDRHLVGFDRRLKDPARIKEKIVDRIEEKGRTPEEAISLIPDTIRYTFQYEETRYTQGVWADIVRMKEHGFKLSKLKNFWEEEQYKGINSQWIESGTGQRFEVQFHTRISFEAKQLTHDAYERLRTGQPDEFEKMVLKAFQRKVSAEVPVPLGAADIPDYPERDRSAR